MATIIQINQTRDAFGVNPKKKGEDVSLLLSSTIAPELDKLTKGHDKAPQNLGDILAFLAKAISEYQLELINHNFEKLEGEKTFGDRIADALEKYFEWQDEKLEEQKKSNKKKSFWDWCKDGDLFTGTWDFTAGVGVGLFNGVQGKNAGWDRAVKGLGTALDPLNDETVQYVIIGLACAFGSPALALGLIMCMALTKNWGGHASAVDRMTEGIHDKNWREAAKIAIVITACALTSGAVAAYQARNVALKEAATEAATVAAEEGASSGAKASAAKTTFVSSGAKLGGLIGASTMHPVTFIAKLCGVKEKDLMWVELGETLVYMGAMIRYGMQNAKAASDIGATNMTVRSLMKYRNAMNTLMMLSGTASATKQYEQGKIQKAQSEIQKELAKLDEQIALTKGAYKQHGSAIKDEQETFKVKLRVAKRMISSIEEMLTAERGVSRNLLQG